MASRERPPRAVLLSALRLLGDVVLSTPLIGMVHEAHPECEIDFLVPAGMGAILRGDRRLRRVIEHRRGRSYLPSIALRYDWAIATNGSDRSVLAVGFAGRRRRIALTEGSRAPRHWWRHMLLTHAVPLPVRRPVVSATVQLARAAGLQPTACRVELHDAPDDIAAVQAFLRRHDLKPGEFAVMHGLSRMTNKEWEPSRMAAVSDDLLQTHGLRCVWTGSPDPADRQKLDRGVACARHAPVLCAGDLPISAMHALLRHARVYVGVDTAITHVAAAAGTPCVALFGPTPTCYWSPWNNERAIDHAFPDEPGSFRNGHVSVLQDAETFRREHRWEGLATDKPSLGMAAIGVEQVMAEVAHQLTRSAVHSAA